MQFRKPAPLSDGEFLAAMKIDPDGVVPAALASTPDSIAEALIDSTIDRERSLSRFDELWGEIDPCGEYEWMQRAALNWSKRACELSKRNRQLRAEITLRDVRIRSLEQQRRRVIWGQMIAAVLGVVVLTLMANRMLLGRL